MFHGFPMVFPWFSYIIVSLPVAKSHTILLNHHFEHRNPLKPATATAGSSCNPTYSDMVPSGNHVKAMEKPIDI